MQKWILAILLMISTVKSNAGQPAIYVHDLLDAIALSETIDKDIIVIFTAEWCYHCVRMKNDIIQNPEMIEDKIICYIDKDNAKDLVKEYKVKTIPDYFILRDKIELGRTVGYQNKDQFKKWITNVK